MLGDGIRFLDLRIGFLPGHQQLGFYHGNYDFIWSSSSSLSLSHLAFVWIGLLASALLSSTVTLPDVLLGFYRWLDDHPTETVFISIKVDNATFADPPSDQQPSGSKLQTILEDLLTDELGSQYWYQTNATVSLFLLSFLIFFISSDFWKSTTLYSLFCLLLITASHSRRRSWEIDLCPTYPVWKPFDRNRITSLRISW